MDQPILMNLYIVSVNDLMMCMKEDIILVWILSREIILCV